MQTIKSFLRKVKNFLISYTNDIQQQRYEQYRQSGYRGWY